MRQNHQVVEVPGQGLVDRIPSYPRGRGQPGVHGEMEGCSDSRAWGRLLLREYLVIDEEQWSSWAEWPRMTKARRSMEEMARVHCFQYHGESLVWSSNLFFKISLGGSPASLWSAGKSVTWRKGHCKPNVDRPRSTRLHQENALLSLKSRDKQCQYDSMKFNPTEGRWKTSNQDWKSGTGIVMSNWSTSSKSPVQVAFSWAVHWIRFCGNMHDIHGQYAWIRLIPSTRSYLQEWPKCTKDGHFQLWYSVIGWANFMTSLE